MSKWQHLFIDGEFGRRSYLLSGLTLEVAKVRPPGAPHSIYDELWHAAHWQSIVVRRDRAAAAAWESGGQQFPSEVPEREGAWQELVTDFLAGADKAVELGRSPAAATKEGTSGAPLADVLECLALHNAYHLGKIVALRQTLGAWPPTRPPEE